MKAMMKSLASIVIATVSLAASSAHAQTAAVSIDKPFVHPKWSGVWQGDLGGIPAVTLTLADDAGAANGTIVFHLILKTNDHPYSASTEPHTLIEPHIDGDTMRFQVKRGNGSNEILNMSAELQEDGNMQFTCSNCSREGTKAELIRLQR